MSVTRSQIYGFTVNGADIGATSLSGYTWATPFTFSLSAATGITQAAITNSYQLIWWFGDGTYSTDFAPTHTYNWPGAYEVKLGLYNNNAGVLAVSGTYTGTPEIANLDVITNSQQVDLIVRGTTPFTFSKIVTAYNYVSDAMQWDYTYWPDLSAGQPLSGAVFHGYQSCKSGTATTGPIPLRFTYTTSIKDPSQVKFYFYAQNSLSQPWSEIENSQLISTRPSWRFTTVSANPLDDGLPFTEYIPVSSTYIYILSSGTLSSTGTLVGLSGAMEFYYIDDTPSLVVTTTSAGVQSLSANPTILWVTLETNSLPNLQEYNYTGYQSFSNSSILLSSYYYVQTLIPDHINVTVNGDVGLNSIYWPTVESRFVSTIASSATSGTAAFLSNKTLLNYPLNILSGASDSTTFYMTLSTQFNALSTTTFPTPSAVFNISTNPSSGNNLYYNINNVDSAGRNVGGVYIGTFTPYTTATEAVLYVSVVSGGLYYFTDLTPSPVSGYNPLTIPLSANLYSNTILNGYSNVFKIVDFNSTYFARKFNANFDYAAQIKNYALQPTIAQNEVLFDIFFPAIAGVSATNDDTFGGVIYEKIANYVANSSDPYTSNVSQFYALTKLLGLELDNYDLSIPPTLSRVVDTYSVQQSRVWGTRSLFSRNFTLSAGHTNLGPMLSAYKISTALVSAGQKIVFNDIFGQNKYEVLEVPAINSYASVTARNMQSYLPTTAYPASAYPLRVYPMSAFFGWGVQTPISQYYRVYAYIDTPSLKQVEGLINWDDPITTLSENTSGHNDWIKDGGILETIYNYYIHKGLGLL